MLFLREVEGFTPEYIKTIVNGPEPAESAKKERLTEEQIENIKKTIDTCIIGIAVNGDRATLLYSAPEGFSLNIVKLAKINGKWKIIAIDEHPKLSQSEIRAVVNYWKAYHPNEYHH